MQIGDIWRIVSVNVGKPHKVDRAGRQYETSIDKYPIAGRVAVHTTNLDGDAQADLRVHGGPEQAIYVYGTDNYAYWRTELARDLPWGTFGENLTIEGLRDEEVMIGDQFKVGATILMVTRPRIPCFKLAGKLDQANMIDRVLASGRTGFYFSVIQEGDVAADDLLTLVSRNEQSMTVREISELVRDSSNIAGLQQAVALEGLAGNLRSSLQRKLQARTRSIHQN
jgi:MOSC domain-containing protein YiiM